MEGLLATQILHLRPRRVDRRRFLISATATVACAGVLAPVEQVDAAGPEMVLIGAPKRPQSDIQSWNVGLITAYRRELAPAENEARDAELRNEIRRCFGLLCLRGRYIENYRLPCARPMDEHDYLVIGNEDDSGNLKGFLRKYGRKYGQESVIYKGYYRDAHLHALRNLPRLGMNDGDSKSLGRFHPKRLGVLHTLMTSRSACTPSIALKDLQCGPDGVDSLGGRWEVVGLWTPKSFFSRAERRVAFDDADAYAYRGADWPRAVRPHRRDVAFKTPHTSRYVHVSPRFSSASR
jgi:hypothetical protein